jgi:hypothetical protein
MPSILRRRKQRPAELLKTLALFFKFRGFLNAGMCRWWVDDGHRGSSDLG